MKFIPSLTQTSPTHKKHTPMNSNTAFAIGVGMNTTSRDIDTLDLLEISMASYNSDFMLLNQITLVIGHNLADLHFDGMTAKTYADSGLLDDVNDCTCTIAYAHTHIRDWLERQYNTTSHIPYLLSNDDTFVRAVLKRFMPETLEFLNDTTIDTTAIEIIAKTQDVPIRVSQYTSSAFHQAKRCASVISQGYITPLQTGGKA